MRAFCTVSAPLEVCASSAEQLSPGSRFLALRLLGNHQPKTLYFLVDAKSRVREVYTQTCLHFATQGMLDTELFGLAVLIDGEYMFADPESKLSKYGPKSWRSSHTHGLDANGRPLLELHFRVQFYIESPFMLKDETSRHNYYLQLKYNALQRDIPKEYSDQSMLLLAGLALQADLGDAPIMTRTTTTPVSTSTSTSSVSSINNRNTAATANTKGENNLSHDANSITATPTLASAAAATTTTKTNSILPITAGETIAATASIMTTTTTTLPNINRRTNSNPTTTSSTSSIEKMLRLSTTFAKPITNHVATTSTTFTSTSTSSTSSSASASAVFPISGSLKRSLNAVAATLSPLSSTMSINRNISPMSKTTTSQPGATAAPTTHHTSSTQIDYFRLDDYLPVGLRNAWAATALRACHRENLGMSSADAELHYIQQACLIHESINAHTYRMRMAKSEQGPGNSWFVVYAKGIKIYGVSDAAAASQQTTFLWPNITKLSFERKKFEIRSGDSKITLYATSDEKNKMLLTLCKETHQFSMKIAARLKEVIKREEEENNCLHACYIYSRSLHLPYKNKNDQRISVISSTSSNTTSGIVSDRVHSEDELEIMINTPPAPIAAPSTESLALAHLLDRPSVSRQTSSVGQVSLKELEDQLVALSVRQQHQQHRESPTEQSNNSAGNSSTSSSFPTTVPQHNTDSSTATDSPSSQHNVGSQCSSTCSTVVVALPSDCNSTGNQLASLAVHPSLGNSGGGTSPTTNGNRRNSTSSSLELGFSHTAQNSTLSEAESTCHEHDFITTPSRLTDETESVSGVYTLAHGAPPTETSGVYTMHSSEMTGQSSEIAESESQASSHYGIFQPSKSVNSNPARSINLDAVDGANDINGSDNVYRGKRIKNEEFRLRSDSNVSTSGSFRGDGSDPTDQKHTLLSAEELTELIVGRGTYPCRKTVSNTLDSDCDYVTLPLTMAGDSYIQGHQDTAPSEEDHVDDLMDVLLPTDPPAPPQRIDSNASNLSNIRVRSPPPYNARHEKTGLCGPPVHINNQLNKVMTMPATNVSNVSNVPSTTKAAPSKIPSTTTSIKTTVPLPSPITSTAIIRRDPPPYPNSTKPRPTSLVSLSSTSSTSALRHVASTVTRQRESHTPTSVSTNSMSSLKSEEITARFITTRPHINILKAHTSVVNENPKPCYAAPTQLSLSGAASSTGSVASNYLSHNSNYASSPTHPLRSFNVTAHHHHHHHQQHHHHPPPPPVPAASSQLSAAAAAHVAAAAAAGAGVIPSTIGIPIVPYSLHAAHKSMSSLHQHQQPPPPPPPYPDMKPSPRTCVLLPVIKPRQYLPPPPPSLPRQPPPPPPPQLATMYTGQLARKQLELYQQQLYSDVDYVIYPIQDPAVSQQEYLDAKQSSLLAAMAQSPPPHPYFAYHHHHHPAAHHPGAWDTCKAHAIYRSTPYLPLALSTHSRYASTQNLSDTYIQLPGTYSPLYSPSVASLCSSYEPPPPPLHPGALAAVTTTPSSSNLFVRSRSDDNILNSIDSLPKVKRLPPPPPPPYVNRRLKKPPMPTPSEKPPPIPSKPIPASTSSLNLNNINVRSHQFSSQRPPTLRTHSSKSHMTKTSSGAQWAGERPKPDSALSRGAGSGGSSILSHLQASVAAANKAALNAAATASKSPPTTSGRTASTAIVSGPVTTVATAAAAANDIDIALLREKSKILDLPLITALCNDRSLLKQTKAFVPPKNIRNSSSINASMAASATTNATATTTTITTAPTSVGNHIFSKSVTNVNSSSSGGTTSMNGGSTTPVVTSQQLSSATITTALSTPTSNKLTATTGSLTKPRKASISHRHPNDKLPPLPMQLAEANNYVMDPALLKHHKSYNSQT